MTEQILTACIKDTFHSISEQIGLQLTSKPTQYNADLRSNT